jgi:hypothetical protein
MRQAALFSMTLFAFACGRGGNNNPDLTNNKPDMSSSSDGGGLDMSSSDGGGVLRGSFVLAAVPQFTVNKDNLVIGYNNLTGVGISAVDVDGGTPTVIDDSIIYSASAASHVIASWGGDSFASSARVGPLTVWKKGMSAPRLASSMSALVPVPDTEDGSFICFADNSIDGGNTDLAVEKTDGTGTKKTIATDVTNSTGCPPFFLGVGTKFYLLHCTGTGQDGGAVNPALYVFDTAGAAATETQIAPDVINFGLDTTGAKLWYVTSANTLFLTAVPGTGTPTQVDTNVSSAYLSKDGSILWWISNNGVMKKWVTSDALASATTLIASGVTDFLDIAPNEVHSLLTGAGPDATSLDIQLGSLTTPGTTATLTSNGLLFGVGLSSNFTADSAYAVWYDNIDTVSLGTVSASLGDLHVQPMAGGPAINIATKAWTHASATGSKLVFSDNWHSSSNRATPSGTADLHVIDLSNGTKTDIALQSDATFAITRDGTKVVFNYQGSTDASKNGLYVAPIP